MTRERTLTSGHFECVDCHRQWNAAGEVHCSVCHEHFAGYTMFDLHIRQKGEEVMHRDPRGIVGPENHRPLLASLDTPLGILWQAA